MPKKRGEMGGPAEQAFGELLRSRRQELGLTQEQVAERAGCDRGYIGLLERGVNSPTLSMLFQLAAALGQPASVWLASIEAVLDFSSETGQDRAPF